MAKWVTIVAMEKSEFAVDTIGWQSFIWIEKKGIWKMNNY